jgi:hypothetical protein
MLNILQLGNAKELGNPGERCHRLYHHLKNTAAGRASSPSLPVFPAAGEAISASSAVEWAGPIHAPLTLLKGLGRGEAGHTVAAARRITVQGDMGNGERNVAGTRRRRRRGEMEEKAAEVGGHGPPRLLVVQIIGPKVKDKWRKLIRPHFFWKQMLY